MSDEKRRFVLRENGTETNVTGKAPRQATLKAARRLKPEENEEEALANTERICLREHGTIDIHIYDTWAWKEDAPDDGPEWLGEEITQANVSKVDRVES